MLNPDLIAKVAQKLDPLGLNFAFVGGSIVELLLDRPDLSPMRPTDDLDVIVEVMAKPTDVIPTWRWAFFIRPRNQGVKRGSVGKLRPRRTSLHVAAGAGGR